MKISKVTSLAMVVIMIIFTTAVRSESKPEDQIKYRQSAMMFMRWNMAKIEEQVVKNPTSYNKDQVSAAANAIVAVAHSGLGSLFTPDTKTGKGWIDTKVKSDYFDQPQEVKKYASAFRDEAEKLADVAQSADVGAIKLQFDSLFSACKDCHKKFREKDKPH